MYFMILLTYTKYSLEKNEDGEGAKIIIVKNHHDAQRSTVDSRRLLTNFKMFVSHLMSAVLRQSNYC